MALVNREMGEDEDERIGVGKEKKKIKVGLDTYKEPAGERHGSWLGVGRKTRTRSEILPLSLSLSW